MQSILITVMILCSILTALVVAIAAMLVVLEVRRNTKHLKEFIAMKTNELLDAIFTETNNLGDRIAARDAKIKDVGELTPELEAEGQAIVNRLKAIAADPANPIPVEEPAAGTTGSGSNSGSGAAPAGDGSTSQS